MTTTKLHIDKCVATYTKNANHNALVATFISIFKSHYQFYTYAKSRNEDDPTLTAFYPLYIYEEVDIALLAYRNRYLVKPYLKEKHKENWYYECVLDRNIDCFYETTWLRIGEIIIHDIADSFYKYVN